MIINSLADANVTDIPIANMKQMAEALSTVLSEKSEVSEAGQV